MSLNVRTHAAQLNPAISRGSGAQPRVPGVIGGSASRAWLESVEFPR